MNKIIPFKKEIDFDSIYQINSISLEHNISKKEDNIVKGNLIISGSYKVTESSINIDNFDFELPFEINIDSKYNTDNITVDINDFYYEIVNNKKLSLNIEIIIDNLEEKELKIENEERSVINIKTDETDNKQIQENKETENIFDGLECSENYVTYKVHIMTENDTLETIIKKYETKKSILEDYNNLMDLKIGDKIIIPTND